MAGEAARAIVDFTKYMDGSPTTKGDEIYLVNTMKMTTGRMWDSADPRYKVPVMKIVIGDDAPDASQIPTNLRQVPDFPYGAWKKELADAPTFELQRGSASNDAETEWLINGLPFDATRPLISVKKESYAVWKVRNGGGWVHPMHLHQEEEHRVVMRNGKFAADARHPDGTGKEDVVALDPSEEVAICRRFRTFVGPYVAHCHNLAHEDHNMMFGWEILPEDREWGPDRPAGDERAAPPLARDGAAASAERRRTVGTESMLTRREATLRAAATTCLAGVALVQAIELPSVLAPGAQFAVPALRRWRCAWGWARRWPGHRHALRGRCGAWWRRAVCSWSPAGRCRGCSRCPDWSTIRGTGRGCPARRRARWGPHAWCWRRSPSRPGGRRRAAWPSPPWCCWRWRPGVGALLVAFGPGLAGGETALAAGVHRHSHAGLDETQIQFQPLPGGHGGHYVYPATAAPHQTALVVALVLIAAAVFTYGAVGCLRRRAAPSRSPSVWISDAEEGLA